MTIMQLPKAVRILTYLIPFMLILPAMANGQTNLAALAATFASLPANTGEPDPSRGARPALTTAKHQLRDWIEGELTSHDFADTAPDAAAGIAARLNGKLVDAGLKGLADVRVWRYGRVLIVNTSFPIECGSDDSVYGWVWNDGKWVRAFGYEKTDYDQHRYSPQSMDGLEGVHFAPVSAGGRYIYVLTTAVGTWCTSGWLGRRFQLHRVDVNTAKSTLLVDRELYAFVLEGERGATLSSRRMMITYTGSTVDARKLPFATRVEIYRLSNQGAKRLPDAAADAEDFIERWLTSPWEERANGASRMHRDVLHAWHRRLHPYLDHAGQWSSFAAAARCQRDAKVWQYGVIFGHVKHGADTTELAQSYHQEPTPNAPAGSYTIKQDANVLNRLLPIFIEPTVVYFQVREDAPNIFTMIDIRKTPREGCPLPSD